MTLAASAKWQYRWKMVIAFALVVAALLDIYIVYDAWANTAVGAGVASSILLLCLLVGTGLYIYLVFFADTGKFRMPNKSGGRSIGV